MSLHMFKQERQKIVFLKAQLFVHNSLVTFFSLLYRTKLIWLVQNVFVRDILSISHISVIKRKTHNITWGLHCTLFEILTITGRGGGAHLQGKRYWLFYYYSQFTEPPG